MGYRFCSRCEVPRGPTHAVSQQAFKGYYAGHLDTYLSTDISSKTEATMMHINYSKSIGAVKNLPEIYLVQGRSAVGQLAVFGSEPGEVRLLAAVVREDLHLKGGLKAGADQKRQPGQQA